MRNKMELKAKTCRFNRKYLTFNLQSQIGLWKRLKWMLKDCKEKGNLFCLAIKQGQVITLRHKMR